MSKCPFWSSNDKKVNCYTECPMYDDDNNSECVFKEHITVEKIDFKDIVDYDLQYSKDKDYDLDLAGDTTKF